MDRMIAEQLNFNSAYLSRREQEQNLSRVRSRIAPAVLDFARRCGSEPFGIEQLQAFVRSRVNVAPASPDRILRDLRARGLIEYEVINRRAALYRITRAPT